MVTEFEYRYLRSNGRRFKMTRDEAMVAFDAVGITKIPAFLDFQTVLGLNGRESRDELHPVVDYQRRSASNWKSPEIVGDLPWDDVTTEN